MKILEKRYNEVVKEIGNITVSDKEYTKNDFKKWATAVLSFWYGAKEPINICEHKREISNEIVELEKLASEKEDEWIYLN